MPATLKINRESLIAELRRAPFDIQLDGTKVGTIERHGSFETEVAPGQHTLQVKTGRWTSHTETFAIADGDTVHFRATGARTWPFYLISMVVPSMALILRRDETA